MLDALRCLVVAARGTAEGAVVFRSMMEDWPGDFAGLVECTTQVAI